MRKALGVILSVLACAPSFACTGERDGADTKSGTETGGTGGSGGTLGGSGGRAGAGDAGASGNANGGAAGSGAGASGGPTGGASGGPTGGASGGPTGGASGAGGAGGGQALPVVLVFSRTLGFRHESIADGLLALSELGRERGWDVLSTEDPSIFSDSGLDPFNVVVFLSTTGDVLDAERQAALERFVRAGGGFAGIHSASDTEYDWPWYGALVGAYFREHPAVQEAVVHVEDATHVATAMLPTDWRRTDEWYAFRENPRPNVSVLLTLDESTYTPGTASMGSDHPIAWFHEYDGGRAFYTALGHTRESYSDSAFLAHIAGGIEWAAGGG